MTDTIESLRDVDHAAVKLLNHALGAAAAGMGVDALHLVLNDEHFVGYALPESGTNQLDVIATVSLVTTRMRYFLTEVVTALSNDNNEYTNVRKQA